MNRLLSDFPRWIVFGIAAFVLNFPVLSTLATSFKTNAEISRSPAA